MDLPSSTAELLAVGTSEDVIAGSRYRALHRGVHVAADVPDSPDLGVLAVVELMRPGDVLGGWAGVRLVRAEVSDVVEVGGVLVTGAVATVVDLIRWATDWREGVVAAECLLSTGRVSLVDVTRFVAAHAGLRGLPLVQRALPHLSRYSWTPGETRLRLVRELQAGLVRPVSDVEVFSVSGHLLGVTDLLDPEAALIGEYDGRAAHRLRQAHTRGLARDRSRDAWFARLSDGRIVHPGDRLERSASSATGLAVEPSSRRTG